MIRKSIIFYILLMASKSLALNNTKLIQADKHSESTDDISEHKAWKYLGEDCGVSDTDKIIGGVDATLGQYPWIALLGYEVNNEIEYLCGGALINHWYVLTAAHCIVTNGRFLKFARLGEHDLNTYIDCFAGVCAKPVQDIPISKIIKHEDYNNPRFANDVALLRLSHKAVYNGWVSSICLPHTTTEDKGSAEVAGWGIKSMDTMRQATTLQTLKVPLLNVKVCKKLYRRIAIDQRNICAGGRVGEDSCGGDSGGPLMKVYSTNDGPKYYLIGIVSFGPSNCGSRAPGVYVRVERYMKWILDNIKQ